MLLVMDMINDITHDESPGAARFRPQLAERDVLSRTAALIQRARLSGTPIGFVRVGFSPDYREVHPGSAIFARARKHDIFKLGTWGTQVHETLAPAAGDYDIIKHRVSPFYGTSLEVLLRANRVERLLLCGVSTNGVVHTGAREAHDRDYECLVVEDCCAAASAAEHAAAISCIEGYAAIVDSGHSELLP
ncbi:isochorismatase family cysteine hydrolase [Dactylosporangium sp. NPDC051485]|uniref:cysteine hydrolase family protein n=1 Tax=Dactylosporangium sp. NPDC051485 TaxID=3154846 RepID=UPI003430EB97